MVYFVCIKFAQSISQACKELSNDGFLYQSRAQNLERDITIAFYESLESKVA